LNTVFGASDQITHLQPVLYVIPSAVNFSENRTSRNVFISYGRRLDVSKFRHGDVLIFRYSRLQWLPVVPQRSWGLLGRPGPHHSRESDAP
jgi:hypothetical protein